MAGTPVLCLAVFAVASALHIEADFSDRAGKEGPVEKVVGMLNDMKQQLEEETKNDAELYDKLVCWCETNDKEKTKAIAEEKQQISDLSALIEELTAKDSQLTEEIATLKANIEAMKRALAEAAEVRAKELAEFNQNEKDMIQSIGSLKSAVTSLEKHNKGASALLQREAAVQVAKIIKRTMKTQPSLIQEAVKPHQRRRLMELLDRPSGIVTLLQQPTGATSYNSQSGEIFGMLKQMKETFENNLEGSKNEEAKAAKDYAQLKKAKTEELASASDRQLTKEKELGAAKEKNARSKEDLRNTEDALEADSIFLTDLKKKCASMDADWAARSKMRGEELTAVSETIVILTNDEANDALTKTTDLVQRATSMIQVRAEAMREARLRAEAVKLLKDEGARLKSGRLTYLARRSKFDPFSKMRDNIDIMVGALGKEKADEIETKDECVHDLFENDKQTGEKHEVKKDLETEIDSLNVDEAQLTDEEKRTIQEIADMQKNMKMASANREQENKEFQQVTADQQATQAILQKAVAKLGEFYNRKAALLQQQAPGEASSPMPEGFGEYKKAGGGGAMAMIQQIITDSKATEKDALVSELDAQAAYEAFIQDTNKSIKKNQEALNANAEALAEDQVEEAHDEADKKHTIGDILKLGDMNGAIHGACDFTLDNFDERQGTRDQETEALKQAKAIFSGAGFGR
jgi:hypothetical protein